MSSSKSSKRPLSPHLQIYRLPLPALMSISHRLSGIILVTGTVLLTFWLVMLASGEESFQLARLIIGHPLTQIILMGYSLALFYHGLNGVRHLFWDAGIGVNIPAIMKTGFWVIAFSIIATILFWVTLYIGGF